MEKTLGRLGFLAIYPSLEAKAEILVAAKIRLLEQGLSLRVLNEPSFGGRKRGESGIVIHA